MEVTRLLKKVLKFKKNYLQIAENTKNKKKIIQFVDLNASFLKKKENLYSLLSFLKILRKLFRYFIKFLQYADGTNSLKRISRLIKITPKKIWVFIKFY